MNPYAAKDYDRMSVKNQPKAKQEQEEDGKIDHPFMEGKKIDMSKNELRSFTKAMENQEFRSLLSDYVQEISDPKNQVEYEQYLKQLEESGDLPVGTKLIKPAAGFCIKTTTKRLMSETTKQYFDQKAFINVCFHEDIEKPQKQYVTNQNGQSGYSWQLPYRVSKGRHDQDKNGTLCSTFDIVFHNDVGQFLVHDEFKKFTCDTAIDGVSRVLAEQKEKCSSDYKILKNLKCKGGEPALLTVKVKTVNKLLNNADVNKHSTQLQKEISVQNEEHKKQLLDEQKAQAELSKSQKKLGEVDEEDSNEEEEEARPSGVVQPKYKIVFSYPVQLEDTWEGYQSQEMLEKKRVQQTPTHITVTINVAHIESMKQAKLDIDETSLVFEYPELYYLDLNLKYICNPSKGNAKHDKSKKTLTIRLPVVGLTVDSQKAYEENYKVWLEEQNKKKVQAVSETDDKAETQASNTPNKKVDLNAGETQDLMQGQSRKILAPIDMAGEDTNIKDEYNFNDEMDIQRIKEEARKDEGQTANQREQFLKVFKKDDSVISAGDQDDSHLDTIKYRHDEEELGSKIKMTGLNDKREDQEKPLIQEIKSQTTEAGLQNIGTQEKDKTDVNQKQEQNGPEPTPFCWNTAQVLEAKFQFFHQKEYVFVNLNFKGYNKEKDVRFALSENEVLVEVRDSQNRVHRLCKTLNREVNVEQSSVELLVDFISIKLKKYDDKLSWDSLGYDIKDFTVPKKTQMKSNFLKAAPVPSEPKNESSVQNEQMPENEAERRAENDKENVQVENTEMKKEEESNKNIDKERGKQLSFLSLESSLIFRIY